MAERRVEEDEVFGEDFNLLDQDLEDFFEEKFEAPDEETVEKEIVTNPENEEDDTEEGNEDDDSQEEDTGSEENEKGEDTDTDESKSNSSSPLIPYAKYLKEEGILPNFNLEEFDGSIEGLREGMFKEIMGGVDAYKESLPETLKHLINNYEEGVPLERLLEINSQKTKYTSITEEELENEDIQKSLVREYLTQTTKFSKEKIEKEINRLADLQELEEEAKTILPELVALQTEEEKAAIEQVRIQRENEEKQRLQQLEELRTAVESIEEVIPGNKLSTSMKQRIYKNLTTPVANTEQGIPVNKLGAYRMKNPVQTEIILNYIFEATNEFKDWSVFNKGAKRTVITELESAAREVEGQLNGRRTTSTKAAKNIIKELEGFEF